MEGKGSGSERKGEKKKGEEGEEGRRDEANLPSVIEKTTQMSLFGSAVKTATAMTAVPAVIVPVVTEWMQRRRRRLRKKKASRRQFLAHPSRCREERTYPSVDLKDVWALDRMKTSDAAIRMSAAAAQLQERRKDEGEVRKTSSTRRIEKERLLNKREGTKPYLSQRLIMLEISVRVEQMRTNQSERQRREPKR